MRTDTTISFPPFVLDLASERLLRGSQPIPLRPKSFAVLRYLVEHPGRLVTRRELLEAVWSDVHVSQGLPKDSVLEIRRALVDDPRTPRFIETAHGRGYRFVAEVRRGAELEHREAGALPGVVGREAEIGRLATSLARAQRGERQLVFVSGEAGIGKTTLLEAFRRRVAHDGVWYGHGQCIEQFGTGEAYLPVLEALGRLCREPGGEPLAAALRERAPSWLAQLPGVFGDVARAAPGMTRERMLRELGDAVEAMTVERPLVIALEDLHWSDHSTLELLSALARRPERARLLVIGTYRPLGTLPGEHHPLRAVVQELRLHRHCDEVRLPFLDETEVGEYIAWRFDAAGASWSREVGRAIHRGTEGNPLFMVHVVDGLVERGLLARDGDRWRVNAAEGLHIEVPADVRQMIERQLDALPADDQRALEAASVAGVEVSAAAVAAGLGESVDAVEARCAALARREHFLATQGVAEWPDGTTAARLRFLHTLHRDVVYARIPAGTRGALHRRIGAREEQAYGAQASERASELAVHFECGGDHRRAVEYRRQAAQNALERHAYRDAVEQFTRAIDALRRLPDTVERAGTEFELQLSLALPLLATRGEAAPEVEGPLARAHELGQRLGDPLRLPLAVLGQWGLRFARGELRAARAIATHLLELAGRTHGRGPQLAAHLALGLTATYEGELSDAQAHLERVAALSHPAGQRQVRVLFDLAGIVEPRVASGAYGAVISCTRGLLERGLLEIEEARRVARECGNVYAVVTAEGFAAMVHQARSEPAAVERCASDTLALAEAHGFPQWAGLAMVLRGWARVMLGAGAPGVAEIRQGLATWRSTGTEVGHTTLLAFLADACGRAGCPDEGLAAVEDALALAEESGERFSEAELHRLRGQLLVLQSSGDGRAAARAGEVEAEYRQALEIARRCGASLFALRAATSLNRLSMRHTRRAKARDLLADVYRSFSEGLDTGELLAARALLDEGSRTRRPS